MEPIISLAGVAYAYRRSRDRALDGIDLAIGRGEFVGVIGPSGAGKSTLAAALSGAIPHHHRGSLYGAVKIAGRDTCEVSLTDIARTVGSVGQDIDAQMVASVVEDELLFGLENFGIPRAGRAPSAGRARGSGHSRPAPPRDRDALRRPEAEGRHRRRARARAGRAGARRAHRRAGPGELARGVRDPAPRQPGRGRHGGGHRAEGGAAHGVLRARARHGPGRVALDGRPREVLGRAGELRRIGVDCPRVARVYNSLAERGLADGERPCLDVPEAAAMVERLVERAHGSAGAERGAPPAGRPAPGPDLAGAGSRPRTRAPAPAPPSPSSARPSPTPAAPRWSTSTCR